MKIKLHTNVAGGEVGETITVADEYGAWLALKGYGVHVKEDPPKKINESNDDHESGSSKRSSQSRKRSS